jgi:hypothetical protein
MKTKATFAIACFVGLIFLSGMATADERMDVSTDQATYVIGESVTISVVNMGNEQILLNGFWVEDAEERCIYISNTLGFAHYLAPGDSYRYVWDQTDDSGVLVETGKYKVNVDQRSAPFEIVNDTITLSTSKATYGMGETIDFAATNTDDSAILVTGGYTILTENGEIIYAENTLMYMITLQPGESLSYQWNQASNSGDRVLDGTYVICANGHETTITIAAETPIENQLWEEQQPTPQVPDLGFITKPLPRRIGPRI